MGSSKFMVIRFRELVKTVVFAVLGAAIIIALIYLLAPRDDDGEKKYNAGVYSTEITIGNETALVETAVDATRIKSVSLIRQSETLPVFYPLLQTTADEIAESVVREQSADITPPEGAQYTASVILNAIEKNLEKAAM